jgi:hypothetical protein
VVLLSVDLRIGKIHTESEAHDAQGHVPGAAPGELTVRALLGVRVACTERHTFRPRLHKSVFELYSKLTGPDGEGQVEDVELEAGDLGEGAHICHAETRPAVRAISWIPTEA